MAYVKVIYRGEPVPNLYQRGDRFNIRVSIDGKLKWVPLKATSVQDARRERDLYFTKPTIERVSTNKRVDELWNEMVAYHEDGLAEKPWSERTQSLYKGRYKRFIKPIIGSKRASDLDAHDINRVITAAKQMRRGKKQEPYSKDTIAGVWVILSTMVTHGQQLTFGPCVGASPMTAATRPLPNDGNDVFAELVLTREDCELLVSEMTPRFKMLFQLAEKTGGRLSELCGLKWTNIDLEGRRVIFLHQLRLGSTEEIKEKRRMKLPITGEDLLVPLKGRVDIAHSQARAVRISANMVALLKAYRMWLMSQGLYRQDGFVFPTDSHRPLSQRNVTRALDVAAAKHKITGVLNNETLPKPIHPHAFRHSFATQLLSTGTVPLEKISRWLGHSSVDVTRKRYAKVLDSVGSREADDAHLASAGF